MAKIRTQFRTFKTVSEAVSKHITNHDYEAGCVETLEEITDHSAILLSNLVELLHKKKLISTKELKEEVLRGLYA